MSMDQLMALVPIEAATALATTTGTGRKSRWERTATPKGKKSRFGPRDVSYHNVRIILRGVCSVNEFDFHFLCFLGQAILATPIH